MKPTIATTLTCAAALISATAAWSWNGPPRPQDSMPDADSIVALCTVSNTQTGTNCRPKFPAHNNDDALRAAAEQQYLDAHPFPVPGGVPGSNVAVMVRLNAVAAPDRKAYVISAPLDAFDNSLGPAIHDPVWAGMSNAAWMSGYVPDRAIRMGVSGDATIRCVATSAGVLVNCWVEQESRPDFGFDFAALFIVQRVRIKPVTTSGQPVAGRPVELKIRCDVGSGYRDRGSITVSVTVL